MVIPPYNFTLIARLTLKNTEGSTSTWLALAEERTSLFQPFGLIVMPYMTGHVIWSFLGLSKTPSNKCFQFQVSQRRWVFLLLLQHATAMPRTLDLALAEHRSTWFQPFGLGVVSWILGDAICRFSDLPHAPNKWFETHQKQWAFLLASQHAICHAQRDPLGWLWFKNKMNDSNHLGMKWYLRCWEMP